MAQTTHVDDATKIVEDTTPQLGGILDSNSYRIQWSKGADIASANALTLGIDGNYFDITGTTAITSIGTLAIGTLVCLHFDGILTLTHNATDLILPSGSNITTAAGDEAIFIEYASGDWRCINYSKADGTAIVGGGTATEKIWFPAEAFYLPVTNPATLTEEAGATVYAGQSHLDFDDTTAEHGVARGPVIDYDGGNIVITAAAKVATTPSGAVTLIFHIYAVGIASSEAYDAAVTVDTGVDLTFSLDTTELNTDIMIATATIDPSNVANGDKIVIELIRNVATDTLSGDGEFVDMTLEYTKS